MNNTRFNELLQLYLDNKATDAERHELMQLIREGNHDEKLKQSIDAMLHEEPKTDMYPQRAKEMLKQIITTANEPAKVVPIKPAAAWRWVAAAAVVVITVSVGWWMSKEDAATPELITQNEEKIEPAVFTGKQYVHLPDGTTVLLNDNSELSYTSSFGEQAREVVLKGEAYFDVQHNPAKPFKVLTGNVTTTVLGTAFNVKAYPDQQEIKVTVTRGKVQVSNDQRTFGIITPDQQIAVNTATNEFVQSNTKAETATAWKSKYMILDDVSMEVAAAIIAEKYNAKIIFSNDDLKACRITATFLNGENLDQVLTVVSGVVQATYTMQPDGNVRIEGAGCR